MIITYGLLASALTYVPPPQWEEFTRTDGVLVEYRYTHDDVLEISATRTVYTCAAAFLHLLVDTERIGEWVGNASKATILAQPTANQHVVHTEFGAIWPVAPRDMVTKSQWQYDPDTRTLTLQVDDASDFRGPLKGSIRMTDVAATWTLQESLQGATRIHYQGLANPEGHIPRGLARRAALRAIRHSFQTLDEMLKSYQYDYLQLACVNHLGPQLTTP